MSSSARASHSLSRRSAQPSLSRQRQQSLSRSALIANPPPGSGRSEEVSLDLDDTAASRELSPGFSSRKGRLTARQTEREQADRKESFREQRKTLLKDKRDTSQFLIQVRNAASEQRSKANRGTNEISKVDTEIQRLEKWRQGQEDRLQQLMQQLVKEEQEMDEEFRIKMSAANDIRSTLAHEQLDLEFQLRAKEDDVRRGEARLQQVDTSLKQFDDGYGVTSSGGWRQEDNSGVTSKVMWDGASVENISSIRLSRLGPSPGPDLLVNAVSTTASSIASSHRGSEDAPPPAAPRSGDRPVPTPINSGTNIRLTGNRGPQPEEFEKVKSNGVPEPRVQHVEAPLPNLLGDDKRMKGPRVQDVEAPLPNLLGVANCASEKVLHHWSQHQQQQSPKRQSLSPPPIAAWMSHPKEMLLHFDSGPSRAPSAGPPPSRSMQGSAMSTPGSSMTATPHIEARQLPQGADADVAHMRARQMAPIDLTAVQPKPAVQVPMIDLRGPQIKLNISNLAGAGQHAQPLPGTNSFFNWEM